MKFIHTADWQLGMKAAHVGAAAARVREERLEAAGRVVATARERGAEFLLIAGDTFEDNAVDRALVQKVADILAGSPVPVYVLPGNHDPLTPGSVWEHPAWRSMEHVHVLREEKPVEIPGGRLYPCPVTDKRSRKDPSAWIGHQEAGVIGIGLAHGTVEGMPQAEPDHPIPRDAASRSGLDYLALGHWHSTALYPAADGAARMAYCGTHETTGFGERDSGNVLLVEIPDHGAAPSLTTERTGALAWEVMERDVRAPGDLAQLRRDIESLERPESVLLQVRVKGLLPASDRGEVASIRDLLAPRFLFFSFDGSTLRPSPEDASWVAGLPPGVLREAAARLQELSDPAYGGGRPEGATPEVAGRALLELYAIMAEAGP